MDSDFSVEVGTRDGAPWLALRGELDLASSPTLERELEPLTASAPQTVLDLRELEFMDSTGLSVLVKAHQRAEEQGKRFGLVNGSQQVQRLLTLTGVADRLTLVNAPEELFGGG